MLTEKQAIEMLRSALKGMLDQPETPESYDAMMERAMTALTETTQEKIVSDTILELAARKCEKRADSLTEGSGVARQCAKDIRSMKSVNDSYEPS